MSKIGNKYYAVSPLGLKITYNHVVTTHPAEPNNNDYRSAIFGTSILLIICSSLATSMRMWRSWKSQERLEGHDYLILTAYVCAFVMSAGCAHLTWDGLGMHDYNDAIAQNGHFQKIVIAINFFYFSCNFFVKLGLLQMYRKFTRERWGMYLIWAMSAASLLFWLGSVMATVLECIPLKAVWDWSITEGWCIDLSLFYISNAAIMIGMDCMLYAMPVIFTWKIRTTWQRKFGMRLVWGLGLVVITSSAVRLWIVHQAVSEGDLSYNYGRSLLVSQIENHLAILIACAPAIRGFCRHFGKQSLFQVKDVLHGSRGKFGKLWSSSASSAPSSPYRDNFDLPSPREKSFRLPASNKVSMFGSLFSSKAGTQASSMDGKDLELGFHETTCEFVPTMTTTITGGGAPTRPPSQKTRIYITRDVTVTEEFINGSPTSAEFPASEGSSVCDSASIFSSMSTDTTDVTDKDLAALPMPSPKPSKENFTDVDGVMRKDFAEIMRAHL